MSVKVPARVQYDYLFPNYPGRRSWAGTDWYIETGIGRPMNVYDWGLLPHPGTPDRRFVNRQREK